ncbi:MAG: tyrosine-type recombinase/integrase [Panacagrimonas sp.]
MDRYGGERGQLARIAARMLILTGLRPGELRGGRWDEIDFAKKIWVIPPSRMKMRREHTVPLPSQAVDLLDQLKVISGKGELMFPNRDGYMQPMSDNTLNSMFRRLGYLGKQTGHGFRHLIIPIRNRR